MSNIFQSLVDKDITEKQHFPILWLFLFLLAFAAHLLACTKAYPYSELNDYIIMNSRTIFCYNTHKFIHQNWHVGIIIIIISVVLSSYVQKKQYSRFASFFLFLPINSFFVLHLIGCAYLNNKFLPDY